MRSLIREALQSSIPVERVKNSRPWDSTTSFSSVPSATSTQETESGASGREPSREVCTAQGDRLPPTSTVLKAAWAALTVSLSGCTSSFVHPPIRVEEPARVFIADYIGSLHVGLVCECSDGDYVEFGFGEWEWYARGNNQCHRVIPALLWPTAGTLGRRQVFLNGDRPLPESLFSYAVLQEVSVERAALERLVIELNSRFERSLPATSNPSHPLEFVPESRSYHLLRMCSDEVARWLRELGCKVSFSPIRLRLRAPRHSRESGNPGP